MSQRAAWQMTKTELLAEANRLGLAPHPDWTAVELRSAITEMIGDQKGGTLPKGLSSMKLQELKEEAEKIGLEYGEKVTRGALIRNIRDYHGTPSNTVMTIGKHRGNTYAQIPLSYGRWADAEEKVNGANMHPDLRRYVMWYRRNRNGKPPRAGDDPGEDEQPREVRCGGRTEPEPGRSERTFVGRGEIAGLGVADQEGLQRRPTTPREAEGDRLVEFLETSQATGRQGPRGGSDGDRTGPKDHRRNQGSRDASRDPEAAARALGHRRRTVRIIIPGETESDENADTRVYENNRTTNDASNFRGDALGDSQSTGATPAFIQHFENNIGNRDDRTFKETIPPEFNSESNYLRDGIDKECEETITPKAYDETYYQNTRGKKSAKEMVTLKTIYGPDCISDGVEDEHEKTIIPEDYDETYYQNKQSKKESKEMVERMITDEAYYHTIGTTHEVDENSRTTDASSNFQVGPSVMTCTTTPSGLQSDISLATGRDVQVTPAAADDSDGCDSEAGHDEGHLVVLADPIEEIIRNRLLEKDFTEETLAMILDNVFGPGGELLPKRAAKPRKTTFGDEDSGAKRISLGYFTYGGLRGICTNTAEYASLSIYLKHYILSHCPDARWSSLSISLNTEAQVHGDYNNLRGTYNYTTCAGSYSTGGGLWRELGLHERGPEGEVVWRENSKGISVPGIIMATKVTKGRWHSFRESLSTQRNRGKGATGGLLRRLLQDHSSRARRPRSENFDNGDIRSQIFDI